jgi:Cu2+-exporting ATPase
MDHRGDTHAIPSAAGDEADAGKVATTVLHVGGLNWASEKAVVEGVLGREPGILLVEANPVAQTANVTFDTVQASLTELRSCVEECGYHSVGQSVPSYLCDPMGPTGATPGGRPGVMTRFSGVIDSLAVRAPWSRR